MSRLTIRLPETLHHRMEDLAERENVSLNQYIVYALTQYSAQAYTVLEVTRSDIAIQRARFEALLADLRHGSPGEVRQALDEREDGEPDPYLLTAKGRDLRAYVEQALAKSLGC